MKKLLVLTIPLLLSACTTHIHMVKKEDLDKDDMYTLLSEYNRNSNPENISYQEGLNYLTLSTCDSTGQSCQSVFLNFEDKKELTRILESGMSDESGEVSFQRSLETIQVQNKPEDNLLIVYETKQFNKFVEVKSGNSTIQLPETSTYNSTFHLTDRGKEKFIMSEKKKLFSSLELIRNF